MNMYMGHDINDDNRKLIKVEMEWRIVSAIRRAIRHAICYTPCYASMAYSMAYSMPYNRSIVKVDYWNDEEMWILFVHASSPGV